MHANGEAGPVYFGCCIGTILDAKMENANGAFIRAFIAFPVPAHRAVYRGGVCSLDFPCFRGSGNPEKVVRSASAGSDS